MVSLLLRVVAEGENIQGLFALVMVQLEGLLLTSCRWKEPLYLLATS